MAETTAIQWCDATFNGWIGCTKVSPGCANCYAERDFDLRKHVATWGAGQPRHRTSEAYWRQPLRWNTMQACSNCGHMAGGHVAWCPECGPSGDWKPRRPRVFCSSLADWLDDEVPAEWLADLLNLWRACSNLDILALTKRPQLWQRRLEAAADIGSDVAESWLDGHAPANVWIGTTVEDQARADERIPALLSIPARVRFLSCEPLLGPVSFRWAKWDDWKDGNGATRKVVDEYDGLRGIHWVIAGGESGPRARPMHPDWARSLRDQCAAAAVPFFFKQWGEWIPDNQRNWRASGATTWGLVNTTGEFRVVLRKGVRDWAQSPAWGKGETGTMLVGKHVAGRLLDGREHNEFPEVRHA